MERRVFISSLGGLLLAERALAGGERWGHAPRFSAYPFALGVASGEPTASGVVLWTRLCPVPSEPDGGLGTEDIGLRWQVAHDEGFRHVVRAGNAVALAALAHSVRVDVQGLAPGRRYYYRFIAGAAESPVGRTRTLPSATEAVSALSFVTVSCQHFEVGYFGVYERIIEHDPAFVVHLGDYIYGVSRGDFRLHAPRAVPRTLEDFRLRHALYKTDRSLQRAHARAPFFVTLDNHDAVPDAVGAEDLLDVRAAAYQAWVEHMPVRAALEPGSAALALYRGFDYGNLLRFNLLDTRQFRDDQDVCRENVDTSYGFGIYRPRCAAVLAPERQLLGAEQEHWLERRIESSLSRWNAIGSTTLFSPFQMLRDGVEHYYESGWDYYPAARQRLLAMLERTQLPNPMFLSGDIHSSWAIDVPRDTADPTSAPIATELVCTAITSPWPAALDAPMRDNVARNPHVALYDSSHLGYCLHQVSHERWQADMRVVDDVRELDPHGSTLASFVVESGQPHLQRI